MNEVKEILVAEDEEEIRAMVVSAVREVYPDSNIHEAIDRDEAVAILNQYRRKIYLVVSDGKMCGDSDAGLGVTGTAKYDGVAHVALYSTGAGIYRSMLEPQGIKCISKPDGKETSDSLKRWLESTKPQQ